MKNLKTIKLIAITFSLCFVMLQTVAAMEPPREESKENKGANTFLTLREDCGVATASTDMEINNVRARLWVGGDIWWDKSNGRYIVPKPPVGSAIDEVSSLYAGGVWIGGYDPSGNLKLAASTYPRGEADFFPGPLNENTGLTDAVTCQQWDQFFDVLGRDVRQAIRDFDRDPANFNIDLVPDDVKYWPGQGNVYFEEKSGFPLPNQEGGLGSFWDQNDNGVYEPEAGDFPTIDIRGCEPTTRKEAVELVPDEMIFWIYNDAGNVHRETFGDVINMEIQVQSFAYATNDEVNDMTFYRYKLINRAKEDIRETYFAMWVDPDLGCAFDDYIGCDVDRGLAYTYNVDALDGQGDGVECGGTPTYKDEIPIIGTDYFRGPIAPFVKCEDKDEPGCVFHIIKRSDVIDPFSDCEIGDTIYIREPDLGAGEKGDFGFELGMSTFMYYNNAGEGTPNPATTDPQQAEEYYTYMQGIWRDLTTPLSVGGDGFNPGSTDITRYAFPGAPNEASSWSMCAENLAAGDRRTVQSSGPFLLQPNAVNELIVGAVWVPNLDYPCPNINKLTTADDIAQNLFDNCFDIIDGPDAPTIDPIELDREVVMVLHNDLIESNNARYGYSELDIRSSKDIPEDQRTYVFEGYKVFQLSGPTVSPQELDDIDKARIVIQVDVKNGVSELYNWTSDIDPNADRTGATDFIWTPERKVNGVDEGIRNTFRLTNDAFASGDTRLINHKKYYYMAVAYAYNEYAPFNPKDFRLTQANPYLEGRGNVKTYEVVPRPIVYEGLNSMYGDGVKITRISGRGTGGKILDLEEGMHDIILDGSFDDAPNDSKIVYKEGFGPLDVQVYNPLEVKNGRFRLELVGDHAAGSRCEIGEGAIWRLTDLDNPEKVFESETSIDEINEEIIAEYGISLRVSQQNNAGSNLDDDNGAQLATVEYATDDSEQWYGAITHGVPEVPSEELNAVFRRMFEFIFTDDSDLDLDGNNTDPGSEFRRLGQGLWYPFMLCSGKQREFQQGVNIPYLTPAWSDVSDPHNDLRPSNSNNIITDLNNVDIVMTSDKSKWSRCIVTETGNYKNTDDRGFPIQDMFKIKNQPSVNRDGNTGGTNPSDANSSNYIYGDTGSLNSEVGKTGMSWFPGYAIDVETGKRLNMFFGENSSFTDIYSMQRTFSCCDVDNLAWLEDLKIQLQTNCEGAQLGTPKIEVSFVEVDDVRNCVFTVFPNPSDLNTFQFYSCNGDILDLNIRLNERSNTMVVWNCVEDNQSDPQGLRYNRGNDLLYNPSDELLSNNQTFNQTDFDEIYKDFYAGGQHFIYVTRDEYDGCTEMANTYWNDSGSPLLILTMQKLYKAITWTSMSMMNTGSEILSYENGVVPSDVTFKLRAEKPYNKEVIFDPTDPDRGCNLPEGSLANMPTYEFEILGKQADELVQEEYDGALANINVVPNPYYAYSAYERSQFDRTVKITNVPDRAVITIYSLDGKFIKQFNRAESPQKARGANPGVIDEQTNPAVEWDVKNTAGIPVASGVYLIHIAAEGIGERTIKWFGINRKFDPSGL